MSAENEIKDLVEAAIANLRDILGVNTIIGEKIETKDGVTIIPISRVVCGYVAGGGEYGKTDAKPFAGGSGAGVTVNPVGFLVITGTDVRILSVENSDVVDKAIESLPAIANSIQSSIEKFKEKRADKKIITNDIPIS
ncbi:MAG: spore germination protein GerW family protein [Clostridia bacterium]|nr:spore germination protein GerW family protein [Clostridia bacterium]MDD4798048.1 spore germination protein GerW family protein [Clostridia bacterium]